MQISSQLPTLSGHTGISPIPQPSSGFRANPPQTTDTLVAASSASRFEALLGEFNQNRFRPLADLDYATQNALTAYQQVAALADHPRNALTGVDLFV